MSTTISGYRADGLRADDRNGVEVASSQVLREGMLAAMKGASLRPGIALRVGIELSRSGSDISAVLASISHIGAYVEFTVEATAPRFVLGPSWVPPSAIPDLSLLGCVVEVDGESATTGAGAAAFGHPANAVALLVDWLVERGTTLEAGSLVFTGALTAPLALRSGQHAVMTFGRIGTVFVGISPR